jgi:hypothetical protein
MSNGFNNVPNFGQTITDNLIGGNIGGIFSTRPQAKYMSGARCVLRINGKLAGFAFGISWRINTSYREITAIDNDIAEELVPRRITVDGSISALHIPGQTAGTNQWQPDMLSFLFHQYIQIEVRDSATNQLLFFTPKAVITSRQEEIRVDQLAMVSLNFMAIGWRDEKEPSFPDDKDTRSPGSGLASNINGDLNTDRVSGLGASEIARDITNGSGFPF